MLQSRAASRLLCPEVMGAKASPDASSGFEGEPRSNPLQGVVVRIIDPSKCGDNLPLILSLRGSLLGHCFAAHVTLTARVPSAPSAHRYSLKSDSAKKVFQADARDHICSSVAGPLSASFSRSSYETGLTQTRHV